MPQSILQQVDNDAFARGFKSGSDLVRSNDWNVLDCTRHEGYLEGYDKGRSEGPSRLFWFAVGVMTILTAVYLYSYLSLDSLWTSR